MRIAIPALVAAVSVAAYAGSRPREAPAGQSSAGDHRRTPVLVELFTSEGCSSCPPADRLLAELLSQQPVEGAEIVALGEHVDYWNRLGWRDPFSAHQFSDRQNAYASGVFATSQIYTPQTVVDGKYETIGSDRPKLLEAIRRAATDAHPLALTIAPAWQGGKLVATMRATMPRPLRGDANVLLAVTEDGLSSAVSAGENAGYRLTHAAVARSVQRAGSIARGRSDASLQSTEPLDAAWARDRLRVVCFVQERSAPRILAVAASTVPHGSS